MSDSGYALLSVDQDSGPKKCTAACTARKFCCYCILGFFSLYAILVVVLGIIGWKLFTAVHPDWGQPLYREDGIETTPKNIAEYEWWPGCDRGVKSATEFDKCGGDCFSADLPESMIAFNKKRDFKLVSFSSRRADGIQDATLTAWWLPAVSDAGKKPPVVILVHGLSSSFNAIKVQLPAYYLRSLNFSVLLPNLRGHGSSSKTTHGLTSWGLEYPLDVLGAWDYVINDPDGALDGKHDPSEVGLMGGSLGGFSAANAFGMEERISGLWLNGAIFDPKDDYFGQVIGFLGPVAGAVYDPAWEIVESLSGLDLDKLLPKKTMENASRLGRPVAIIQSPQDGAVPGTARRSYKSLIEKSEGRYVLKEEWYPNGLCNGDIHVFESVKYPREYLSRLCKFWSPILLKTERSCPGPVTGFLN